MSRDELRGEGGVEEAFLRSYLFGLASAGIEYAGLRNYAHLPTSLGGSDLDLLVGKADLKRAIDSLCDTALGMGGAVIGCGRTSSFATVHIILPPSNGEWWGARIDLFTGVRYRGHDVVKASELLASVEQYNSVPVLAPGVAAFIAVVKELLWNGRVPDGHRAQARDWLEQSLKRAESPPLLCRLPYDAAEKLLALLDDAGCGSRKKLAAEFRSYVVRNAATKKPLSYLAETLEYQWGKLRRYWKPSGATIAILGTDGAGKSAVIEGIIPTLRLATHNGVHVRHLRPGLLPPLSRMKGRAAAPAGPVTDPHAATASGTLGSLVRACYYATDYLLGYWTRTRPIIARRPDVVIFDRYCHDMWIDPKRFRIALPRRLLRMITRWLPRPDLVICLVADPMIIHERKPELPLAEVRRQVAELEMLAHAEANALIVRTDQAEADTVDAVLAAIRDLFLSRGNKGCNGSDE